MRRELLDLARHFNGPLGIGANHESRGPGSDPALTAAEPVALEEDQDDLER